MGLSIGLGGSVDYYERDADNECEPANVDHPARHEVDLHTQGERTNEYYTGGPEGGRELNGFWRGPGTERLGLQGKVTSWQLHKFYGEHVDPITGEQLGSKPRNYRSREDRIAAKLAKMPFATPEDIKRVELETATTTQRNRNFFDATFSLPKSYSLLYAAYLSAGERDKAQQLLDAFYRSIDQAMSVYMAEAGFSRKGHHGRAVAGKVSGERVEAHDWNYSYFPHFTSRSGDPQMHVHVLINNVVGCTDGKWRTIDSRALFKQSQPIGRLTERFMAEDTAQTLGLRHVPRADGLGWEVEGIEQHELDEFSTRRAQVKAQAQTYIDEFVSKYGREPDQKEYDQIMDLATRQSRPSKNHDKTFDEYLAEWEQRYERAFDRNLASIVERVESGVLRPAGVHGTWDRSQILEMAIAKLEKNYPTWGRVELRGVLSDVLPPALGRATAGELLPYLDSLVDEAVRSERIVTLSQAPAVAVPDSLCFDSGRSRFEQRHTERFTTARRLAQEHQLVALAHKIDGPRLIARDADLLLDQTTLHPDQRRVAFNVLTKGQRLTLLEAYAAMGKTYTVGELSRLWYLAFGEHPIGLSKGNNAAGVLADAGVRRAYNFDTFRTAHSELANASPKARETILRRYGINPRSLVIVDEISTLADHEMFWLSDFAREHNISMLFVGDRGQVGAVGTNVALDELARAVEPEHLDVARRFVHEWEGPASIGLHDRSPAAITEYEAHGRIDDGTREEMTRKAIDVLVADLLGGHNSLLMVATNDLASELSIQVRDRLIEAGLVSDDGPRLGLLDGSYATAGDIIQARYTTKQIDGSYVGHSISNRDAFRVCEVHDDGSVTVQRHIGHMDGRAQWGERELIPASYKDWESGYVTTVHSRIGRTVENGYFLHTESADWNAIYVALTRGSNVNVIFVPVEHEDGVARESGADVLRLVAERNDRQLSATEAQDIEFELPTHMATLGPIFESCIATHSRAAHEVIILELLPDDLAQRMRAEDYTEDALYRLTQALERNGVDVRAVVEHAINERPWDTAESVTKVLYWRIERRMDDLTLDDAGEQSFTRRRYVELVPEGDSPELAYVRKVAEVMDQRIDTLGQRQSEAPEEWALTHLGPVPDDPVRRLEWEQRAGTIDGHRERFGVDDPAVALGDAPGRSAVEQRDSWEHAYVAADRPSDSLDVARMTDGELLLKIDRYKRIEAWMPPYVADRLATVSKAARNYRTQAEIDRARGEIERAGRSERLAALTESQVADLSHIHDARRQAEEFTAQERHEANVAQVEYDRRHPQPVEAPAHEGNDEVDQTRRQERTPESHHRDWTLEQGRAHADRVRADIAAERARREAQADYERQLEEERTIEHSAEHERSEYGYDR